ncbi:hypothetical protein CANCADRAFT_113521 [Tortispora caseinolytica NRRL Y-17796]|uniref:Gluconokinase n=1 Tax=Tortispora caseinolytica NRRL Y-17796 TaxID=767744 RepID=A0A1E4TGP8_9ASCO|nr:hypothetical protein CANCADRAFT_113521 [Tortispora caseinolytica NRRL Y-17796]
MKKIIYVCGPAGCGKSTVAGALSKKYDAEFIEADSVHSKENIEKMSNGIPLTDEDRFPWLNTLQTLASNTAGSHVVLTCSALKKVYRDILRRSNNADTRVHFVFLRLTRDQLIARVRQRPNHYMKDSMVDSQLADLEPPTADELDVSVIDASAPIEEVISAAISAAESI